MNDENILKLPDISKKKYQSNFIHLAVCELRFPTLLELETKEPVKFQTAIRKEYPYYKKGKNINIEPGSENPSFETVYNFISKDLSWTIALKPSSISLETKAYENFSEFLERLLKVIDKVKPIIDTDFFTRVGLRYIDTLPVNTDPVNEWINPDLTNQLINGELGKPVSYWQEIVGNTFCGKYNFRHGIQNNNHNDYILDFDFYDENVELKDIRTKIQNLHDESIKLFFWSLGKKSIEYMNSKHR